MGMTAILTTHEAHAERFWSRVDIQDDDDACWMWTGPSPAAAYFKLPYAVGALAWMYANEGSSLPVPHGYVVMHLCEGRYEPGTDTHSYCCNPAHLRLATRRENRIDAIRNGRKGRPVTQAQVTGIRRLKWILGMPDTRVSKLLQCNRRTVAKAYRLQNTYRIPAVTIDRVIGGKGNV